jgi:hypothetical protein
MIDGELARAGCLGFDVMLRSVSSSERENSSWVLRGSYLLLNSSVLALKLGRAMPLDLAPPDDRVDGVGGGIDICRRLLARRSGFDPSRLAMPAV